MRAAVIGVGNMGKNHVRIYSQLPDVNLVAVADLNETLGKNIAKKYHTKFYNDFEQLLLEEKPDLVSICVPTSHHYEVAKDVMKQKIHTLLEKPITTDIQQAKDLLKYSQKNKVKFLVGHIERFNPAVQKIKDMIEEGQLGKITSIITRRVGGFPPQIKDANIAVDLAIHDIDIINYLLDDLPRDISVNKQRHHIKLREDAVEFFLKYKKASAYIQSNWISPVKIRKLNITGTEGYLEMDYITQKIDFYKSNYSKFKQGSKDYSDYILLFSEPDKINISVAKKEPLKEEISYFISCIKNNKPLDSNFSLEALKIALT